ncbi:hypothetical protein PG990_008034 [Apiospora arundinis]
MALILELPVELVIDIAKEVIESMATGNLNEAVITNMADLRSLWLTCRTFRVIVKEVLFRWNKEHEGSSAVVWATEHGRIDILEDCRAFGLDLVNPGSHHHSDWLNTRFDLEPPLCCQTPIGRATSHDWLSVVEWFFDNGVSANHICSAINPRGDTTWQCVQLTSLGDEDHVPRWSVLKYALHHKSSSIAQFLIRRGADLTFAHDTESSNIKPQHAIHIAANKGLVDVIKMLVHDHDVDINIIDTDGKSALHYAAGTLENRKTVQLLIALGANLDQRAANGATPLLKALHSGCFTNAYYLIRAGARVGLISGSPPAPGLQSPLQACIASNPLDRFTRVDNLWLRLPDQFYMGYSPTEPEKIEIYRGRIMEMLIERGASVREANPGTPLPVMLALDLHQQCSVQRLLQHGAVFTLTGQHMSIAGYVMATTGAGAAHDFWNKMKILVDCGVSRLDDPFDANRSVLQAIISRRPDSLHAMLQMGRNLVTPQHLNYVIWECILRGDHWALNTLYAYATFYLGPYFS